MNTLHYGTHKYQLVTSALNWADARQAAEAMGGHLAIISSEQENSAISSFLLSQSVTFPTASDGGGAQYVWLGASDMAEEGSWVWTDGSDLTGYDNWGSGINGSEPDDFNSNQDAMAIGLTVWPYPDGGLGSAGQWNDINEDNTLYYLVEWDEITGTPVQGTEGLDTRTYSGNADDYTLSSTDNGFLITSTANNTLVEDELISFERIAFADKNTALDLTGNAGMVAKTLGAVFGSDAVNNQEFVGIGLSLTDSGLSYQGLMDAALNARLGENRSDADVVNLLYTNVTGTTASEATLASYVALLESGQHTQASLGVLASETDINSLNINLTGLQESGLDYLA